MNITKKSLILGAVVAILSAVSIFSASQVLALETCSQVNNPYATIAFRQGYSGSFSSTPGNPDRFFNISVASGTLMQAEFYSYAEPSSVVNESWPYLSGQIFQGPCGYICGSGVGQGRLHPGSAVRVTSDTSFSLGIIQNCSGPGEPPSGSVTVNVSVTTPPPPPTTAYTLTVRKLGDGIGTVTGDPSGNGGDDINCDLNNSNCDAPFNSGTNVTLTAVAATGSHFDHWSRCTTSGTSSISVNMNSAKTCEANFVLDNVPPPCVSSIGVTSNRATTWNITGPRAFSQGTPAMNAVYSVSSTPTGPYTIFPGTLSGYSYAVTPAASQSISGCGGALSYVVTYTPTSQNRPICAVTPGSSTLTNQPVSFTGILPNVGQPYSWEATDSDANPGSANNINPFLVTYSTPGTKTVKITQPSASPDPGLCTVVITTPPPSAVYTLLVTKSGSQQSGTVTAHPPGNGGDDINCNLSNLDCSAIFNSGSSTVLTAVPATGWRFVNWSNCRTGTTPTISVLMDASKTCDANFDPISPTVHTLSVTKSGSPESGTVTAHPPGNGGDDINCDLINFDCFAIFNSGSSTVLTAVPATGWQFMNWSGCGTGTSPTLSVLMDASKTCDANFDPIPPTNLSVTLLANPNQGTAPFSSNLTASVGGTAQGTINYTFWDDCSYNGTSIADATTQCGAHSCKFDGTNMNPQSCAVQYSTPKNPALGFVIVERGTHAANATVPVIVTSVTPGSHLECQNASCVMVAGAGPNQDGCLSAGSSCSTGSPSHLECQNASCMRVSGVGPDTCTTNSDCGPLPAMHLECRNASCTMVDGLGPNTCNTNSDCGVTPSGTCTFTANPTLIPRGNSSILSWSCDGSLYACTVRNTLTSGIVTTGGASGSASVSPATTTSYSLNCNSGAFTGSVTVRVLTIQEVPPR